MTGRGTRGTGRPRGRPRKTPVSPPAASPPGKRIKLTRGESKREEEAAAVVTAENDSGSDTEEVEYGFDWEESDETELENMSIDEKRLWFLVNYMYGIDLPDLIPEDLKEEDAWTPGMSLPLSQPFMLGLYNVLRLPPFVVYNPDNRMEQKVALHRIRWAMKAIMALRLGEGEDLIQKTKEELKFFLVRSNEEDDFVHQQRLAENKVEALRPYVQMSPHYDFLTKHLTASLDGNGNRRGRNGEDQFFCTNDVTNLGNSWNLFIRSAEGKKLYPWQYQALPSKSGNQYQTLPVPYQSLSNGGKVSIQPALGMKRDYIVRQRKSLAGNSSDGSSDKGDSLPKSKDKGKKASGRKDGKASFGASNDDSDESDNPRFEGARLPRNLLEDSPRHNNRRILQDELEEPPARGETPAREETLQKKKSAVEKAPSAEPEDNYEDDSSWEGFGDVSWEDVLAKNFSFMEMFTPHDSDLSEEDLQSAFMQIVKRIGEKGANITRYHNEVQPSVDWNCLYNVLLYEGAIPILLDALNIDDDQCDWCRELRGVVCFRVRIVVRDSKRFVEFKQQVLA